MLLGAVKLPSAIVMWISFGPLRAPPRSSKSCGCGAFGVLGCLLSIFLHYAHHCRMVLSGKESCLLLNGVSTESQKRTSVLQIRRDFSPTRHMTRINVGLALSLVKLLLSSWRICVCSLVTWYTKQIVGIPMGTNCIPLVADLFLYCCGRNFVSDLRRSKRFDLIDKFSDTSRCLGDVFAIDGPDFAEHIPDIYPRELQLNKANTSDRETSFLDLNIEVVGGDIHAGVCGRRDDFGFPIVNFPWLGGGVPGLPSCGVYISQLVRFAGCCAGVFDFRSGGLQVTSGLLTQGCRCRRLRGAFGGFFGSCSELLSGFGEMSFRDYVSQGIAHPVFFGDLVYKLRRVKGEANFISSGSGIVKRLRRRQCDPAIIERTIGFVLGPFTALYRSFLKRCTLTNKAVGTI